MNGVIARKTISHTSIYTLGMILRNLASFVMLPIYTRYLTTEDYGILELLSMLIDFVGILLGLRLSQGIFKYYYDTDDEVSRGKIISNSMLLAIGLNVMGVLLIYIFSEPISRLVFGSAEYQLFVILFSLVLILQSVQEIALVYIKAQQRPWLYVSVSIIRLVIVLSLNIYFVVYKDMHVAGVIYSALIGGTVISLWMLWYTFKNSGIYLNQDIIKRLTQFSFPLMLAGLAGFYITFGDRYFLRVFNGLGEVGVYSLGYKFGFMLLQFTWAPFQNIWDTQRYEIYHHDGNRKKIFQDVFILISIFMILVALCIALFVKDVLIIMSAPEFHAAYKVVPLILMAYLLQAWTAYSNFGIMLAEKTYQITYGSIAAVLVISLGYFFLIPVYGAMGAAFSAVVAFLARLLWIYFQAKRLYDMELPWWRVLVVLLIASIAYWISLLAPEDLVYSILFKIVIALTFIASLVVLPVLRKSDRDVLVQLIINPLSIKQVLSKA